MVGWPAPLFRVKLNDPDPMVYRRRREAPLRGAPEEK
jgi:hypothetical protein